MTILTFSYFSKKNREKPRNISFPQSKVAVLYVTYNDFKEDAAMSCVKQDYSNFHTFILDDSDDIKYIKLINSFAAKHRKEITVIKEKKQESF